jgi:exodeoxyribonuclease V alpha subunit
VIVGQQRALEVAVRNNRVALRNTGLAERLSSLARQDLPNSELGSRI